MPHDSRILFDESELTTSERYEAWYQQITQETVSIESLFPVTVANQTSDHQLEHIQLSLRAKYDSAKTIAKPITQEPLPIEATYINLTLVDEYPPNNPT